jgi:hypothetical protein
VDFFAKKFRSFLWVFGYGERPIRLDLEEGLGLEWSRRWRRDEVLVAVVEEEVVVVVMVGFRDSSSSSLSSILTWIFVGFLLSIFG